MEYLKNAENLKSTTADCTDFAVKGITVVGETDVEADVVHLVAGKEHILLICVKCLTAKHYYIVFPVFDYRCKSASYLVDVDHERDLVLCYDLAVEGIMKLSVLNHFPQCFGSFHIVFVGIEGDEYDMAVIYLSHLPHGTEYLGEAGYGSDS